MKLSKIYHILLDRYLIPSIALALLMIPSLYWGGLYHVGGDDTRMYWIMPKAFFEQYSSSIITQNRLGTYGVYASPAFLTPFYIFIWIISFIPMLNVQFVMYGINLSLGFVFFYLLMGLYIREESRLAKISRIAASLAYVLSNFLISTLYSHELMSIFAVSVCPILLYLFVRSVREHRYEFPVICALLYSIVSATLITLPWYGAFFFSVIPLLLFELKQRPKVFISMFIIFLLTFIPLNIHWIIHMVAAQVGQDSGSAALSLGTLQNASRTNANYIEAISHLNSILAQLFQQERTGWGVPIVFNPLKALFLLPLLLGGIVFSSHKKDFLRNIYLISVFSFLLTILLFTPNVDRWSLQLFLLFNAHIPLFAMFKTSYDKFALPLAFQYSFLLSISLWVIAKMNKNLSIFLAVTVMTLSTYFAYPLLFPTLKNEQFSTKISGTLNADFVHMTSFIKEMNTGAHFVWLPLTFPSYIYIEDGKLPNHFYSGPSLITPLTNKIDYTGELSFDIPKRPGIARGIIKHLHAHEYDKVGRIFQELGIKYIIVNKQALPESAGDYRAWLWGSNKLDELQPQDFFDHIKGNKIATFGQRYEVFEINEKYMTDVIYLTQSPDSVGLSGGVSYRKKNESEYIISVQHLERKAFLVLLEPFYSSWKIYLEDRNGAYTIPYAHGENIPVFGHGNAWEIDPVKIRDILKIEDQAPVSFDAIIIFEKNRLQKIGNTISIAGYVLALGVLVYAVLKACIKRMRMTKTSV